MIVRKIGIVLVFSVLIFVGFFAVREVMDLVVNRGGGGFGEEAKVQRDFVPIEQWGERDTSRREVSKGDFIVRDETVTILETRFLQSGNIIVEGEGKLIFIDSILEMSPGENDSRANIFVKDQGELIFERSTLKPHPDDPRNLYVNIMGEASFVFRNSQGIHMLIAKDNAKIEFENSTWAISLPDFRGGGVQVRDRVILNIKNSTIGGLILELTAEAQMDINDFEAGKFERFSLKEDFNTRNIDFTVILENSEILGDYYEGASERGLAILAPSKIRHLKVSNSTLNKLVIISEDENLSFDGLRLGEAQDFAYRNISFVDSKIAAQWGFFMHGGRGVFSDSEGLWFSLHDDVELTVRDSEMNDFDSRDFTGIIDFEDVVWKNTGEIIGNNDFIWRGSWFAQGFDPDDLRPLIWNDSRVTREFLIDIVSMVPEFKATSSASVEIFDNDDNLIWEGFTNKEGRVIFSILFDDTNYRDKFSIKVAKGEKEIKHSVDFLTPTPIKLILK